MAFIKTKIPTSCSCVKYRVEYDCTSSFCMIRCSRCRDREPYTQTIQCCSTCANTNYI